MIDKLLEKNLLPDPLVRFGIRRLLRQRLRDEGASDAEARQKRLGQFIDMMNESPIAVQTMEANQQHYELPTRFFQLCLGPRLKYSSCYYAEEGQSLAEAEVLMLQMTASRAGIKDGERVLELGCGWGSLSLFNAERFPKSSFVGVSNSRSQKAHIDAEARRRGLKNLKIITADMNHFRAPGEFDRVVSVEMFEHMRNWSELFKRVASWLKPKGTFFLHVFTHKELAYLFEAKDDSDWMSRYFFSGGMMPSDSLPLQLADDLKIKRHWIVNGRHYQRTAEDWLKNMDKNKSEIMPILRETYGEAQSDKWWGYWRVFYMSCAELWGYDSGNEWFVSHYLFEKRA